MQNNMQKTLSASLISISLCLVLVGCGEKKQTTVAPTSTTNTTESSTPIPSDTTDTTNPTPGTPINAVVKTDPPTAPKLQEPVLKNGVWQIKWEHLVPKGFEPETLMAKYREQIDRIPEGSPEESVLFEEIMNELNTAPVNQELNGKRVRLPGFISPLDEKEGQLSDFLLVPYFGACIHVPPPPVNQTLLVKPTPGKSIPMSDIYQPVWVVGDLKAEKINTELADAGYTIENAELEIYTEPDPEQEAGVYNNAPAAMPN